MEQEDVAAAVVAKESENSHGVEGQTATRKFLGWTRWDAGRPGGGDSHSRSLGGQSEVSTDESVVAASEDGMQDVLVELAKPRKTDKQRNERRLTGIVLLE